MARFFMEMRQRRVGIPTAFSFGASDDLEGSRGAKRRTTRGVDVVLAVAILRILCCKDGSEFVDRDTRRSSESRRTDLKCRANRMFELM